MNGEKNLTVSINGQVVGKIAQWDYKVSRYDIAKGLPKTPRIEEWVEPEIKADLFEWPVCPTCERPVSNCLCRQVFGI